MPAQVIKLFGPLTEIIGSNEIKMNDLRSTTQLKEEIIKQYPELSSFVYSIAINQEIMTDIHSISPTDEIALLPPFAGG